FLRHRGIADAKAFQARAFEPARGVIARRIGEKRSATPLADGLRFAALIEQLANGIGVDTRLALNLQPRADEPLVIGSLHLAIADCVLGRGASVPHTAAVQHLYFNHMLP